MWYNRWAFQRLKNRLHWHFKFKSHHLIQISFIFDCRNRVIVQIYTYANKEPNQFIWLIKTTSMVYTYGWYIAIACYMLNMTWHDILLRGTLRFAFTLFIFLVFFLHSKQINIWFKCNQKFQIIVTFTTWHVSIHRTMLSLR